MIVTRAELDFFEKYALEHPEDEQFALKLSHIREQIARNPMLVTAPLYKEQADFLASRAQFTEFAGGNKAGKTHIGVIKDLIELLPEEFIPDHLKQYKQFPSPTYGRIVTPGLASNTEVVIFEKLRQLTPKEALKGGSWETAYSVGKRLLQFECGSWLQFLTSEMDLDKHAGTDLHFVHFDEEPKNEKGRAVYQENITRLLVYGGKFWMTMTPLFGMSWSWDEIYEKRNEPDFNVIHADMDKNPTLNQKAKAIILSQYSKEERLARKEGRYVHFDGLVYPEFRKDTHVVPPPTKEFVQNSDEVIVGIDPGLKHTSVTYHAFDKDDSVFLFDELHLEEYDIEEVADEIFKKNKEWGIEPDYYIIDPSARNRTQFVNVEQIQSEFEKFGVYCTPGQNAREPGILQMRRRLQSDPPAFIVADTCERFLYEIARYRYDKKADGTFDVHKVDDHQLDSSRYVLMHRTYGPVTEDDIRLTNHTSQWKYGQTIPVAELTRRLTTHPSGAMA